MKVFIVLACVAVSCASAGSLGGYGLAAPAIGYASSGHSTQFRSEDNYGNYNFGYDESHATGSTGRREERSGDIVRGSYNLNDADGRQRTVNYVADHAGFRASVHTNEPGVDAARDPAAVLINKEAALGYAAAPVAAPLPVAPIAAPLVAPLAAPAYHGPAPVAVAGPLAGPAGYGVAAVGYEAPAPRAFSYSFGAAHPSRAYAAPAPILAHAPLVAPAPVYRDGPAY